MLIIPLADILSPSRPRNVVFVGETVPCVIKSQYHGVKMTASPGNFRMGTLIDGTLAGGIVTSNMYTTGSAADSFAFTFVPRETVANQEELLWVEVGSETEDEEEEFVGESIPAPRMRVISAPDSTSYVRKNVLFFSICVFFVSLSFSKHVYVRVYVCILIGTF